MVSGEIGRKGDSIWISGTTPTTVIFLSFHFNDSPTGFLSPILLTAASFRMTELESAKSLEKSLPASNLIPDGFRIVVVGSNGGEDDGFFHRLAVFPFPAVVVAVYIGGWGIAFTDGNYSPRTAADPRATLRNFYRYRSTSLPKSVPGCQNQSAGFCHAGFPGK